jgi:hypothetical protein
VPTEQRPGRHEEGSPPFPRKEPTEGGEERAVDWAVPNPTMELALQNTHLVAEDNKLDVLVYVAAPTRDNEGQDTAEPGVHEREGHHPMLTGSGAECQLRALIGILVPFTSGSATRRATNGAVGLNRPSSTG